MKKGIKLDSYNQRLTIQKIYNDGSLGKKFYIWFVNNYLKLEVDAPSWNFFTDCTEVVNLMRYNIIGVDLHMIKEELINCGYIELR